MIYTITNLTTGSQYIGQTTQPLNNRLSQHWYHRNTPSYRNRMYSDMLNSDRDNWKIEPLDMYDDDQEALAIKELNTMEPNGYNIVRGVPQIPTQEKRYLGEPLIRNDGMVFEDAKAAAKYLFEEEGYGRNEIGCYSNLMMHLGGKTNSCYHHFYKVTKKLT